MKKLDFIHYRKLLSEFHKGIENRELLLRIEYTDIHYRKSMENVMKQMGWEYYFNDITCDYTVINSIIADERDLTYPINIQTTIQNQIDKRLTNVDNNAVENVYRESRLRFAEDLLKEIMKKEKICIVNARISKTKKEPYIDVENDKEEERTMKDILYGRGIISIDEFYVRLRKAYKNSNKAFKRSKKYLEKNCRKCGFGTRDDFVAGYY